MDRWDKVVYLTTSFFVLIDETLTRFFKRSRGLRQGAPLSPFSVCDHDVSL